MDAQTLLRHHQRTLPNGDGGEHPRLFTAGSATPNPPNVCLAAAAFQGGLNNVQVGWAHANATHLEQDLCDDWSRQKRVIVVPGLSTKAHAVVFNDGSALLGWRIGDSLRLYPGVLWLRTKAYGGAVSVHMGGTDGPARLHIRRADDTKPMALTSADLARTPISEPDRTDTPNWWAWALRADIDRFDPVFWKITPDHYVPKPGEGHTARPGYPLFLPRPGLDAPSLLGAKELAQSAMDWIACTILPTIADAYGGHPFPRHFGRHGARNWTFGWTAGVQSRIQRTEWTPEQLACHFPPALAAALENLGARDLGWRYVNQRMGRPATPVVVDKPRGPFSAHATVALVAAWGAATEAHRAAWLQLIESAP